MRRILLIATLVMLFCSAAACSMIGKETDFADRVSTSGAGPFRSVDTSETGTLVEPTGTILRDADVSVDSGAVLEEHLYYSGAAPLMMPPPRDPMLPPASVDWAQYEPRQIFYSPPAAGVSFALGTVALSASQPWEGTELLDPRPHRLPDGRLRLYYAAAGGIGVAEAANLGAPLTRVGTAPVIESLVMGGPAPRSPALVEDPEIGTFMYFEEGDSIYVASTSDGLVFQRLDADPSTPAIDPLYLEPTEADADAGVMGEVRQVSPGVMSGVMPGGRRTIRLYFERWLSDGTRKLAFAASLDGLLFERSYAALVSSSEDGSVVPYRESDDVIRLYFTELHEPEMALVRRALMMAVSPPERRYD